MIWWSNLITRKKMIGKPILKTTGEGCQDMHVFKWVGKIIGFEKNKNLNCDNVIIEILIHNRAHGDARDAKEKEIYKYPLVNGDIQNVNGIWVLFG